MHGRRRGRSPVAIGAEVVHGVRPDLRLDALGPQRLQRLVPPVELDDVRLPAVAVAVGGARRQHEVLEPLGVPPGDSLPRREELLEPGELRDPDRAEDVG